MVKNLPANVGDILQPVLCNPREASAMRGPHTAIREWPPFVTTTENLCSAEKIQSKNKFRKKFLSTFISNHSNMDKLASPYFSSEYSLLLTLLGLCIDSFCLSIWKLSSLHTMSHYVLSQFPWLALAQSSLLPALHLFSFLSLQSPFS